jgi:hypothetical protein
MMNLRSFKFAWLLLAVTGCGGDDSGGNQGANSGAGGGYAFPDTSALVQRCSVNTDCFANCHCILSETSPDTAGAECAAQCSAMNNPPPPPPGAGGSGYNPPPQGMGGSPGNPPPPGAGGAETIPGAGGAPAVPDDVQSVTVQTDIFDIPPGGDSYKCQNIPNPFGRDVDIIWSESLMTAGSHHMFVFREAVTAKGPIQDCSGVEFKGYIHSAQGPHQVMEYPQGVGRLFRAGEGLRFLSHYLNAGTDVIHAQVVLNMKAVDPSKVTGHAAEIFLNRVGLSVRPGQVSSTSTWAGANYDFKIIGGVSHMHKRGVHFKATTEDGRLVYEGNDWDEPEANSFPNGLEIKAGTSITFTCDYENNTGRTLSFGESAENNEMCIYSGTFYPAPGGYGIASQILF